MTRVIGSGISNEFAELIMDQLNIEDNPAIEFTMQSEYMDSYMAEFTLAECKWRFTDNGNGRVMISLISGKCDKEALTFAVLKGKIHAS